MDPNHIKMDAFKVGPVPDILEATWHSAFLQSGLVFEFHSDMWEALAYFPANKVHFERID